MNIQDSLETEVSTDSPPESVESGSIVHESHTIHELTDEFTSGELSAIYLYLNVNEPTKRNIEKSGITKKQLVEKVRTEYTLDEITEELVVEVPQSQSSDSEKKMTLHISPIIYLQVDSESLLQPLYVQIPLSDESSADEIYQLYNNSNPKQDTATDSFTPYPIQFKPSQNGEIELQYPPNKSSWKYQFGKTAVSILPSPILDNSKSLSMLFDFLFTVLSIAVFSVLILSISSIAELLGLLSIYLALGLLFRTSSQIQDSLSGDPITNEFGSLQYIRKSSMDSDLLGVINTTNIVSEPYTNTEVETTTVEISQTDDSVTLHSSELDVIWELESDSEVLTESQIQFLQEVGFENIDGEAEICYTDTAPNSVNTVVETSCGTYLYSPR